MRGIKRIVAVFVVGIIILSVTACSGGGNNDNRSSADDTDSINMVDTTDAVMSSESNKDLDFKIVPAAAKSVEFENYSDSNFSITIPKGWVVTSGGAGMYNAIRIYDPATPVNQIFFLLKADILLHSAEGKQFWQTYGASYGGAWMGQAPVLYNPSTEGLFQIFSEYASFVEAVESSYAGFTFPRFDNFIATESFESNSGMKSVALNPAVLRGTFTENGVNAEGMFTADVVDSMSNSSAVTGFDNGWYTAYNVTALTAQADSFIEWEPILTKCMSTLQYTDSFVSSAIAQSNQMVETSRQLSSIASEMADGIMDSWERRNTSQDIMSQKQSDAILGYERVYDTQTGETYKAYNGFTDDYWGERYKSVTDDNMYTEAISGYIEK